MTSGESRRFVEARAGVGAVAAGFLEDVSAIFSTLCRGDKVAHRRNGFASAVPKT